MDTIWNNHEPRNNLPWVQLKRLDGDHFLDIFLCIPAGKRLCDFNGSTKKHQERVTVAPTPHHVGLQARFIFVARLEHVVFLGDFHGLFTGYDRELAIIVYNITILPRDILVTKPVFVPQIPYDVQGFAMIGGDGERMKKVHGVAYKASYELFHN